MKNNKSYLSFILCRSLRFPAWYLCAFLLVFISNANSIYGQPGTSFRSPVNNYNLTDTNSQLLNPEDEYDEISITLNVPRIGSLEIPAFINGQDVYLSIKDLFDFLKIWNVASADFDRIDGFFIYPRDKYTIDKTNNRISYKNDVYELSQKDLVRTESNLYLKSNYFGQIFGLDCIFIFRSLSVTLNTKIELPAIREMQQELMRRNIRQLKGERKADTVIQRRFSWLHLGTADWSVFSTQGTMLRPVTRANLGIGAIVAGGEMNLSLNYNSTEKLNLRQQAYQWRYVDNENPQIKQVIAGKIYTQSTASLFSPVIGLQLTNTPTTYRKSFGTYTISNTTEPGWIVELYVNNVLVDYKKADASGFYAFEVPMIYGNSIVKLRFYGPWGEEKTSEKFISIPFNFIPMHQFEYNLTSGYVEDGVNSRYSRANFNYGVSRGITIGTGLEYLSSVTSGKFMPFFKASLKLGQNIMVSGEHTYGVRSTGLINFKLPSNLQLELNYTVYNKNQKAIATNFLDEKKIVLSTPFRGKNITAFGRLTINQFTLPSIQLTNPKIKNKYTSAELLLSAVIAGISSNLTTYAILNNTDNPLIFSNLSVTVRLPAGIRFTPQAQYEYKRKNFSQLKAEIEKNIFHRGFLNFAYEKTLVSEPITSFTLGLRYNFSFAQTFFAARKTRNTIVTTSSARGSLLYDGKTNFLDAGTQTSVGKGGFIILPFLDLNCNGKRDKNEPKAFGLNLRTSGGHIEKNLRDTTLRITGLEAYANYFIELDKNSFDNVAWKIYNPTINATVDPNSLKLIEVPVSVVGEASGKVYLKDIKGKNGLGRIIVNFYNSDSLFVARTVTEADGYFSFLGLAPGRYNAQIDMAQMKKLQMTSAGFSFTILPGKEGDLVNDIELILQPLQENK